MSEFWRVTLALLVGLLVSGTLGWYVARRTAWAFSLPKRARTMLLALLMLGLVAAVIARLLGRPYAALAAVLGQVGGAVMLAIVISALLLVPVELGRAIASLFRSFASSRARGRAATLRTRADGSPSTPARSETEPLAATLASAADARSDATPSTPARREFIAQIAAGSAVSLGFGAAIYGTWVGRRDYTVETVPIKLAKLPRALDGLTIVQLSDLHVGTYVSERELSAALQLVRDAKPDLIVLTGDLLDHDVSYAPMLARFARSLSGLARHGVHAIPGNHDYYAGAAAVMQALREAGTDVLLNRHVRIGQGSAALILAGLDDVQAPRFDSAGPRLDLAFDGLDEQLPRVLLSHNPSYFRHAHALADLTLSGHTHGGQITMFINPAELVLRHGFVRGHYSYEGSQLYVNRGFGTAGPPARIGSAPEITRLVLHV